MTKLRVSEEIKKGKSLQEIIDRASAGDAVLYVYVNDAYIYLGDDNLEKLLNSHFAPQFAMREIHYDFSKFSINKFCKVNPQTYLWKKESQNFSFSLTEINNDELRIDPISNEGYVIVDIFDDSEYELPNTAYPIGYYDKDDLFVQYIEKIPSDAVEKVEVKTRGGDERTILTLNAVIATLIEYIKEGDSRDDMLSQILNKQNELNFNKLAEYLSDKSTYYFDTDIGSNKNFTPDALKKRFTNSISQYLKVLKKK